jgi:hypothetical protein
MIHIYLKSSAEIRGSVKFLHNEVIIVTTILQCKKKKKIDKILREKKTSHH